MTETKTDAVKTDSKPAKKRSPKRKTPTKKSTTTKKRSPKKKPAKKTPTKKPPKKDNSNGLRKPQLRILSWLAKQSKPKTRLQISEGSSTDMAMLNSYIGAHDVDKRKKNDEARFKCLLTLKYVKDEVEDVDGKDTVVYSITATGKKAIG